jgi:hypothetical protein
VRGIDREKVVVWGVKGEFLTNFYRGGLNIRWLLRCFFC